MESVGGTRRRLGLMRLGGGGKWEARTEGVAGRGEAGAAPVGIWAAHADIPAKSFPAHRDDDSTTWKMVLSSDDSFLLSGWHSGEQ